MPWVGCCRKIMPGIGGCRKIMPGVVLSQNLVWSCINSAHLIAEANRGNPLNVPEVAFILAESREDAVCKCVHVRLIHNGGRDNSQEWRGEAQSWFTRKASDVVV